MEMAITGPSPEASDNSVDNEHGKVELGRAFVKAQPMINW